MVINKGEKEYKVREKQECWVVLHNIGELSVEYKIPKNICKNEEELREYIEKEELF